MKLTNEQIRSLIHGAAYTAEKDGKVVMYRFTEEQSRAYQKRSTEFYKKNFCTAGIRLEMMTDSETLELTVEVHPGTLTRKFFAHTVYVNNMYIGRIADNSVEKTIYTGRIADNSIEKTIYSGRFHLGTGEKKVCVYFPWSAVSHIVEVSVDDGATVAPVKKSRRMILFGDSITHGVDAQDPANSYASLLVDALDADGINKAIGGETFFPELATLPDGATPDLITVAYGSNDWSHTPLNEFKDNCRMFYTNLRQLYPNAKIFALTPIWRKDYQKATQCGKFSDACEYIASVAESLPDVTAISCYDFVPKNERFFSDLRLHPNDLGFAFYGKNLMDAIQDALKQS